MFRWLITLSIYYWLFFAVAVLFDFCPSDTQAGKIIKQYQIKLMGKPEHPTN